MINNRRIVPGTIAHIPVPLHGGAVERVGDIGEYNILAQAGAVPALVELRFWVPGEYYQCGSWYHAGIPHCCVL